MSQTVPFGGKNLRVRRKNGSAFDLICMASTKELMKTNEFDDATVIDCDNPDVTSTRRSIKKRKAWSMNISGTADGKGYATLDADCDAELPTTYQFEKALPAAQGGGIWQGDIWYENLSITSDENGIVKFKAQMRGDGALVFTAAQA